MAESKSILDRLLEQLEASEVESVAAADSIDEVLGDEPRRSSVRSLRDDPVVQQFRAELAGGRIRADTANRLLEMLGRAMELL